MLFIWFTRATALCSLFSLFASPLFLIFYHPRLHAQPLPFSLSIEINFLTLSCPSLLSRVCLWQLGWVLIGFTMVRSVLRWGFVVLIDFRFCFSFPGWWRWCSCGLVIWLWFWWLGLRFRVVVIVAVVVVAIVVVEWVLCLMSCEFLFLIFYFFSSGW